MNFIIQIIVGVVLSLASSLLQQAFAKPQDRKATGTRGATQIGGKIPQYFLMGTVGEAGKLEYSNTWGENDGVPNAYITDVLSFGDLPISGMTKLYVNGVRVSIPTTGAVAQGYPVPEYAGHLWWKFFDGSQTAADSYLVSKFGGDADRAWASDMVGRGVPYLITTALWSETLWTGFPSYVGEFQGIKLYDPRKDSTAGGSGSQRWGQPETYEFSDNNLVMVYNIERGIYHEGQHVWGGRKSAAELPYGTWAAAMDACDEGVPLANGAWEKRFRAGRRVNLNERPADLIRELLIGANARISHAADGTVWPLVGVPSVADGAFSDADVLATEPLGSIPFPNLDEIINGATATYREPQQAWEDKETAPYYRSDLEAEDDGRRQTEGLDLGTTFSGTQAQRILKAMVEEGRRFRKHVVALSPEFAQFRPLQVLAFTSSRFDYSAKLFLITARTVEPFGNVILGLQEIDPADHGWNPEADEHPLTFTPIASNRPPPQPVYGYYVEPAVVADNDGRTRRPAIDAFWSIPSVTVDVRSVRLTVRFADTTTLVWEGEAPRPELGSARMTQALLPDTDYEVQIQYVPNSGRPTLASGWLPVTTPDTRLSIYDINDAMRQLTGVLPGSGSLLERFHQMQDELADLANAGTSSAILFDVQLGEARAYFIEQIALVVDATQAAVTLTTLLLAEFDDNIAVAAERMSTVANEMYAQATYAQEVAASYGGTTTSAFLTMTARAGADGWDVSMGWIARAEVDGTNYEMGLYLLLKDNGESAVAIKASSFYLLTDTGGILTSPFTVIGGVVYLTDVRITGSLIVDETITTNLMLANAVTGGAVFTQVAEIGAGATLVSGVFNVTYGSVKVLFIGSQNRPWEGSGNFGGYSIRILRNRIQINSLPIFYDDNFSGIVAVAAADDPGPGTHTYSIDTVVGWGQAGFTFAPGGQLILDNFKR